MDRVTISPLNRFFVAGLTGWEFYEASRDLQLEEVGRTDPARFERHLTEAGLRASYHQFVSWKSEHGDRRAPAEVNGIPRPNFIDFRRFTVDGASYTTSPPPPMEGVPDYVTENMLRYGHPDVAALTSPNAGSPE